MTFFYALSAACFYGTADFLGGIGSRMGHWSRIALVAQMAGLVLLATLSLLFGGTPTRLDLLWGLGAGLGLGSGICLLYRALASGQMGVVAPITALCSILLPCLVAIAQGYVPSLLVGLGIAAALPALVLISFSPSKSRGGQNAPVPPHAIATALAAGICLAAVYICLNQTSVSAGLWPALSARVASATLCLVYVSGFEWRAGARPLPPNAILLALGAGVLDATGNAFLLIAVRAGELATVATLTSLYPAATILLAGLLLKERLNSRQQGGLFLAGLAILAITQSR